MLKTSLLFFVTALAEIIGCFLPYLWLRKGQACGYYYPQPPVWRYLCGY